MMQTMMAQMQQINNTFSAQDHINREIRDEALQTTTLHIAYALTIRQLRPY